MSLEQRSQTMLAGAAAPRPPFRADHVGSILRSAALKEARAQCSRGMLAAAQLKEIEDREIAAIIRRQEDIGLKLATDGEYRRQVWSIDFLQHLIGVESYMAKEGVQFSGGVKSTPKTARIVGRIDFRDHPMIEHFRFLKAHTHVAAKMTIPSPTVLHFRIGRGAISRDIYPDLAVLFDDLANAYRKAIGAFYDAGCRYLQLDDTVWAYLCSDVEREKCRARGDDPDKLPDIYARMIDRAIGDRPKDMFLTTHLCRGNFRSSSISEGGYEPIAEMLLGALPYDGYFLEYDTARAGGFEPLRFLPAGNKRVVLGLVSSKFGALESADDIKRRIDAAGKYVDLDQLCLSPQCGFASTEEGNILAEDEQWAKLRLIVEIARDVWGSP
ncbi:MAG: 5-methyltetrahydropteroyltriglutamate--homocysteine S-methyltransferase [Hyphomicrobiales bacterium]